MSLWTFLYLINLWIQYFYRYEFLNSTAIFDVFGISLVHGWICDPKKEASVAEVVGKLSYNQLQDWLIKNCAGPVEMVICLTELS